MGTKKPSGRVTFQEPTVTSPLVQTFPKESEMEDTNGHEEDAQRKIFSNFILMSVLFAACHGTVVACLDLAYARLGDLGAWQSGALYLTYTASALLGATFIVKKLGARDAMFLAMSIYCIYVGCFLVATVVPNIENVVAISGAAIGGVGAGFLWTAQGSYFAQTAEMYSVSYQITINSATSFLGGVFAFIYLTIEVSLKLLSSAMIEGGYTWSNVFAVYLIVAILSSFLILLVDDYDHANRRRENDGQDALYKMNAAWRLLKDDTKMQYMIGLNSTFALTAAFLISFVSGTVEPIALNDYNSVYIGILFSITSAVAAILSLVFAYLAQITGKGIILTIGSLAFFMVGFLFFWFPNIEEEWNQTLLIILFTLQGVGRATFESTLRATYADMFPDEREGAFANIILQNGGTSTLIFFFTTFITPRAFQILIMISSLGAIWGYWRAFFIYKIEQDVLSHPALLNAEEDALI